MKRRVHTAGPDLEQVTRRTLLQPDRTLEADRRAELAEFFGADQSYEVQEGDYDQDLSGHDDQALFDYLEQTALRGLTRNLLRSGRLKEATALLPLLTEIFAGRAAAEVRVLDFGCGVSDHGLALASFGYRVTIADIPAKIRFAAQRYRRRGLPVETIEMRPDNWKRPEFGPQDAILAGEVLEHLRYPIENVASFQASLPVGGLLWVSSYPYKEKRRGGTHLDEAFNARLEMIQLFRQWFRRRRYHGVPGYLLIKRRPGWLDRWFG